MDVHPVLIRFITRPVDHAPRLAALRGHVAASTGAPVQDVTGSTAHRAEGIVAWVVRVRAADARSAVDRARGLLADGATGTATCTAASVTALPG